MALRHWGHRPIGPTYAFPGRSRRDARTNRDVGNGPRAPKHARTHGPAHKPRAQFVVRASKSTNRRTSFTGMENVGDDDSNVAFCFFLCVSPFVWPFDWSIICVSIARKGTSPTIQHQRNKSNHSTSDSFSIEPNSQSKSKSLVYTLQLRRHEYSPNYSLSSSEQHRSISEISISLHRKFFPFVLYSAIH